MTSHTTSAEQLVQLDPRDLPQRLWDVAIVGAGPAGSIAALRLARRGHRVLLLERRRFPRDKACGDGLIPDALNCLERNGLYGRIVPLGRRSSTVTFWSPSRIACDFSGEFVCVKRAILDAELAAAAVEAGAALCHARVEALEPDSEGVRVAIGSRAGPPLCARYALVASGADVSLLRPHGMVERPEPSAVALRCYMRSEFEIDRLVVSLDRSLLPGYAWIFPVGEGEYNVGCGVISQSLRTKKVDLRAMLDCFLREFPLARELHARATHAGPVRGAQLRCGLAGTRVWDGGRILASGESLGATFPFSGEGIGKAMETAEMAADFLDAALTDGGPEALAGYGERLHAELRPRYLGYEVAERWLSRRWVGDLVMRRARRSPAVRAAFEGVFTETVDPRRVFSLPGLLRLLVA